MRPAEWKGRREESEVRAAGETRGVELRQRRGRRAGHSEAWGSGAGQQRVKHTLNLNMSLMSVTLDVSKLSG